MKVGDYKKLEQFYKTDIENANEIIAELQARIDKAIEYIDSREWENCEECMNIVYDILKGDDKE